MVISLSAKGLTHGEIAAHPGRGLRRRGVDADDQHDYRPGDPTERSVKVSLHSARLT